MSKFIKNTYLQISYFLTLTFLNFPVLVHTEAYNIGALNNVSQNIYDTIKFVLPSVTTVALAILAINFFSSLDNPERRNRIAVAFLGVVLGVVLIYAAPTISNSIISSVNK